jgi:hypothetical protein
MKPRIIATFRPQAWINDHAVDIDGKVEFDATEKFLSLSSETIASFKFNNYDSDVFAEDLPQWIDHQGPFEVDLELSVDDFFSVHGLDRNQLTKAQLDKLRVEYGVKLD